MKKNITVAFLFFTLSTFGQLPPYVRGPLTTNTPENQSNIVRIIISPAGIFHSTNGIYFPHGTLPLYVYNSGGGFLISSPNGSVGGFRLLSYLDDCYFQNTSTGRMVFSGLNGVAMNGNIIFNTGTNVGIATMTPAFKLSVVGTIGGSSLVSSNAVVIRKTSEPAAVAGSAQFYSADNAGVAEMFVQGDDGVETQISPHAGDAPESLYDREGNIKEMMWREISPFSSNGFVSFINARRMAKITELNTKAILWLSGETNSSFSNALAKLKAMKPADRNIIANETFDEYKTRTGKTLQVKDWDTEEQARQVAYDQERSKIQSQYDAVWLINSNRVMEGVKELLPYPEVPPSLNVKRPKPDWLK